MSKQEAEGWVLPSLGEAAVSCEEEDTGLERKLRKGHRVQKLRSSNARCRNIRDVPLSKQTQQHLVRVPAFPGLTRLPISPGLVLACFPESSGSRILLFQR